MDTIYIKVYICEVSFREFFLNIQILKILKNGYSSGTYLYSIGTSVSKPHRRKYILHHQEKRNCAKLYFLHKLECIYLPFTYLTDKICRRKYFYLFIVLTLKKRVFLWMIVLLKAGITCFFGNYYEIISEKLYYVQNYYVRSL